MSDEPRTKKAKLIDDSLEYFIGYGIDGRVKLFVLDKRQSSESLTETKSFIFLTQNDLAIYNNLCLAFSEKYGVSFTECDIKFSYQFSNDLNHCSSITNDRTLQDFVFVVNHNKRLASGDVLCKFIAVVAEKSADIQQAPKMQGMVQTTLQTIKNMAHKQVDLISSSSEVVIHIKSSTSQPFVVGDHGNTGNTFNTVSTSVTSSSSESPSYSKTSYRSEMTQSQAINQLQSSEATSSSQTTMLESTSTSSKTSSTEHTFNFTREIIRACPSPYPTQLALQGDNSVLRNQKLRLCAVGDAFPSSSSIQKGFVALVPFDASVKREQILLHLTKICDLCSLIVLCPSQEGVNLVKVKKTLLDWFYSEEPNFEEEIKQIQCPVSMVQSSDVSILLTSHRRSLVVDLHICPSSRIFKPLTWKKLWSGFTTRKQLYITKQELDLMMANSISTKSKLKGNKKFRTTKPDFYKCLLDSVENGWDVALKHMNNILKKKYGGIFRFTPNTSDNLELVFCTRCSTFRRTNKNQAHTSAGIYMNTRSDANPMPQFLY